MAGYVGVAVIGTLIIVAFWVFNFGGQPIAGDSQKWSEFGGYVGGTLAPVLAFASFIGLLVNIREQSRAKLANDEREDSTIHFENATKSLERAFRTFMGDSSNGPVSDRLIWLSVARLIMYAQSVAKEIKVLSISEMYEAEEEYWRRRFYDVIQPTNSHSPLANADYFRKGEKTLKGHIIDERSIRVMYEFIEWPKGREDPIDKVERFTAKELDKMVVGKRGIKDYVESLRMPASKRR